MNDSISRQAAIRWVKTECNPYGKPTLDFESGKKVIEHLEQMPSADRPQGEWIGCRHEDSEWLSPMADFYKCSICGKIVNLLQMRSYNYCPNCGAKMKGADDEP